ncbi:MAG: GTP-binding protein [Candidatus Heimdallarchaeota archaeon]|nr:GTP-binding protein [Candidatus Heimdallarchaeota archaeon]
MAKETDLNTKLQSVLIKISVGNKDFQHTFKILILGDAAVGKSSLVQRFVHGKFERQYLMTIGMEPYTRFEQINGTKICYSLWDIAGEDKFKVMRKMFFQGAAGSLVAFDLTRRSSFDNLENWITEAKNVAPNQSIILVGNKNDLEDQRVITTEEGNLAAKQFGCIDYIETSALTGIHVANAFNSIGKNLLDKYS